MRLSVGATPSSGSLRVRAKEEKKYMFSALSLQDRTEQEEASVEEEGHRTEENTQTCGVNVLDDVNIRKRVLLPEQFGRKSLINHLLFALGAPTSLAAVHYLCTLHLVIPCPRQDVMGCALSVLYHSSYLETGGDNRKKGSISITL